MTFTNYLKEQFIDFVDSYKNFGKKTLTTTIAFTVLCFVAVSLLIYFSTVSLQDEARQTSIQNYFWYRYSMKEIYCLADLAKIIFIFFVSLFSIALSRIASDTSEGSQKYSFGSFMVRFKFIDLLSIIIILLICCIMDFGLSGLSYLSISDTIYPAFDKWFHSIIFLFRIYFPMILFSITVFKLSSKNSLKLSLKKMFFLFVSLWLFNEFAYEFYIFMKHYIFGLLLVPFEIESKFLYESLLEIIIVAFYFIGFYSAMTFPLKLDDKMNAH